MNGKQAREIMDVTRFTMSRYVTTGQLRVRKLANGRYDYFEDDVHRLAKLKGKWRKDGRMKPVDPCAEHIASVLGYNLEELRSPDHSWRLSDQRKIMARVLSHLGWSRRRVGFFLNRDHSSVTAMLRTSYYIDKEAEAAIQTINQLGYGKEEEETLS